MFRWLLRILMVGVVIFVNCKLISSSEDDWIDPSDMLNYDTSSQTMVNKKPLQKQNEETTDAQSCNCKEHYVSEQKHQALKDKLETCTREKELLTEPEEPRRGRTCGENSGNMGNEGVFFRQYINALALNFATDGGSYQMQVTLSEADVEALVKFAGSQGRVEDAHDVLTSMVDHVVELDDPRHLSWLERTENYIGMDLASLCKIMAVLMMVSVTFSVLIRVHHVPWRQFISRLTLALFFISIPWNWWHLYKKALAKRHADLLKDWPPQCSPSEQTASQSIYQWVASAFTFSSDECAKYHEKLLIDPMWEVPPTQALAVTVTKFLLEPLRHVGTALSDLVRGLLEDMPMYMWPVAIAILLFLTVFILILVCGYKVGFFWNIFGLEPAYRPEPPQYIQNVPVVQQPQPLAPLPAVQAIQNVPQNPQPQPLAQPTPAPVIQGLPQHQPTENIPSRYPADAFDGRDVDNSWVVVAGSPALPPIETTQRPVVAESKGHHCGNVQAEQATEPLMGGQEEGGDELVGATAIVPIPSRLRQPAPQQPPPTAQPPVQPPEHPPPVQTPTSGFEGEQPGDSLPPTDTTPVPETMPHSLAPTDTTPVPEPMPHDQDGTPLPQEADEAAQTQLGDEGDTAQGEGSSAQDGGGAQGGHVVQSVSATPVTPSTRFESADDPRILSLGSTDVNLLTPIEEVGAL